MEGLLKPRQIHNAQLTRLPFPLLGQNLPFYCIRLSKYVIQHILEIFVYSIHYFTFLQFYILIQTVWRWTSSKPVIKETLDKVWVSKTFAQSRLVSVSTPSKLLSLEKSWSRHLSKFPVSKSLGLNIFCFLSLADSIYYMNYQNYFSSIWSNHEYNWN